MKKWITWIVLSSILAFVGYAAYDGYRGGYFSISDLPDDAYPISFRSGFRAIVLDVEDTHPYHTNTPKFFRRLANARPDRRYLGVAFDVPSWYEQTWSFCTSLSEEEKEQLETLLSPDLQSEMQFARLDALCSIETDSEPIARGLIYSVPKQ